MIGRRRIELLTKKKKISPTKEKQFSLLTLVSKNVNRSLKDNLRQFPFLSHQNLTR